MTKSKYGGERITLLWLILKLTPGSFKNNLTMKRLKKMTTTTKTPRETANATEAKKEKDDVGRGETVVPAT